MNAVTAYDRRCQREDEEDRLRVIAAVAAVVIYPSQQERSRALRRRLFVKKSG